MSAAEVSSTEPKAAHDEPADLEKQADEMKDSKTQKKQKPGEDAKDQRIVSFSEFKQEKQEAEEDPSKKVREGQYEI
jgi:hypothetical protein